MRRHLDMRIAMIFTIVAFTAPDISAQSIDIGEVVAALRSRERRVETAHVECVEQPVGSAPEPSGLSEQQAADSTLQATVNEARIQLRSNKVFDVTLAGNRVRFDEIRPATHEDKSTATFRRVASSVSGLSKSVIVRNGRSDSGEHKHPLGAKDRNDITGIYDLVSAAPLVLALRPVKWLERRGFDAATVDRVHEGEIVAGKRCSVVEWSFPASPGTAYELCLAEEQEFTPVRITSRSRGKIRWQASVKSTAKFDGISLPTEWTVTHYWSKRVAPMSLSSTVTSAELNIVVPDDRFEIEYPIGTLVTDHSSAEVERYIVRENGVRQVSESEWRAGVPYRTLANSDSVGNSMSKASRWLTMTGTLAIIIATAGMLIRRRCKNSSIV